MKTVRETVRNSLAVVVLHAVAYMLENTQCLTTKVKDMLLTQAYWFGTCLQKGYWMLLPKIEWFHAVAYVVHSSRCDKRQ